MINKKRKGAFIIVGLFGIYFLLPLLSTLLYAFSTEWGKTIIPQGLTVKWFLQLFKDPAFLKAVGRSLVLSFTALAVILVIMIPATFLIHTYFPKLDQSMQVFSLMPYAIPGVILVTGLLKTYAKLQVPMFAVLVGALFVSSLPMMYQGIRNSLHSLNSKQLIEVAETLGANKVTIFFRIILPNIQVGVLLTSLLVFSGIFGEYVLTQLLIGGRYETIRIYMLRRMNENGHLASAVMILYFAVLLLIAFSMNYLSRRLKKKKDVFNKEEAFVLANEQQEELSGKREFSSAQEG